MEKYITINTLEWDYEQETGIYRSGDFGIVPVTGRDSESETEGEVLYCTLYMGKEWGGEPVGSVDAAMYATQEKVKRMVKASLERDSKDEIESDMLFLGEMLNHLQGVGTYFQSDVMEMMSDWLSELAEKYGVSREEADRLILANMAEMGTLKETDDFG